MLRSFSSDRCATMSMHEASNNACVCAFVAFGVVIVMLMAAMATETQRFVTCRLYLNIIIYFFWCTLTNPECRQTVFYYYWNTHAGNRTDCCAGDGATRLMNELSGSIGVCACVHWNAFNRFSTTWIFICSRSRSNHNNNRGTQFSIQKYDQHFSKRLSRLPYLDSLISNAISMCTTTHHTRLR